MQKNRIKNHHSQLRLILIDGRTQVSRILHDTDDSVTTVALRGFNCQHPVPDFGDSIIEPRVFLPALFKDLEVDAAFGRIRLDHPRTGPHNAHAVFRRRFGGGAELWEKVLCEEKRADAVHADMGFDVLLGLGPDRHSANTGIIPEHIQP